MSHDSRKMLLEVDGLDLSYPMNLYKRISAKDIFIQAIRSPMSLFQKKYENHVLKNITFKVFQNDKIALVGVNGSGKTSLCRCISGVLNAKQGKIKKNCQIRSVIQTEAGFFPDLTGRENARLLSFFLYQDLKSQERHELVEESIDFSGLGAFIDAPIDTYSSGMKSRLSLALTTARPQKLLILDEVYSHADEFFQVKMQERIARQIRQSGAVIMVSHYEKDIINLCNRGIVIDCGEIKYDGGLRSALEAYRFMNGVRRG